MSSRQPRNSLRGPGVEHKIPTQSSDLYRRKRNRIAQPFDTQVADGLQSFADDLRGDDDYNTIYQAGVEKGRNDLGASFDEDGPDLPFAQLVQQLGQVDT